MVNTPVPSNLAAEAKKAAKILSEFSIPSAAVGPDAIIPTSLLVKAEGLAILTVAKIGFLVTARAGSGIVLAKLRNGEWSAPSAIGIAGLGGGLEIGAEVTDFVIILNKRQAVEAFSKGGNLTLGGNFTVAAGPMGRNVEGDVSLRSPAAMYTYSKTKGLFAGISIEGSALIERKETNKKFYGEDLRAYDILAGRVPQPESFAELYDVLARHKQILAQMALRMARREVTRQAHRAMEGPGLMHRFKGSLRSLGGRSGCPGADHDEKLDDDSECGSYCVSTPRQRRSTPDLYRYSSQESLNSRTSSRMSTDNLNSRASSRMSDEKPHMRSQENLSFRSRQSSDGSFTVRPARPANAPLSPIPSKCKAIEAEWDKIATVRAVWSYQAQMPCDLTFKAGDEIEIILRTATQEDWWEGKLAGRVGIFPANYVQVL